MHRDTHFAARQLPRRPASQTVTRQTVIPNVALCPHGLAKWNPSGVSMVWQLLWVLLSWSCQCRCVPSAENDWRQSQTLSFTFKTCGCWERLAEATPALPHSHWKFVLLSSRPKLPSWHREVPAWQPEGWRTLTLQALIAASRFNKWHCTINPAF